MGELTGSSRSAARSAGLDDELCSGSNWLLAALPLEAVHEGPTGRDTQRGHLNQNLMAAPAMPVPLSSVTMPEL